ncbi:MAG: M1 family aminopeptidase [Croceibacterium sp.]
MFASLMLAGCAAVPGATSSVPPFTLAPLPASVPSDLPRNARPLHYAIDVTPDAQSMRFTGSTAIDVEVVEPTRTLTLHALELDISSAHLLGADGAGPARELAVTLDAGQQTAILTAPGTIAPGRYRVDLVYSGKIETQANGLFALDYPDKRTGQPVRGLFTQFEAPDARRFAPMFDEPSYKATFDLSATVPASQMALSNMPVASEVALPGGLKKVTFQTSPRMSSYLLFFGVGDFERLTTKGPGGVELGIVSPAGSGELARYALDELPPIISYYTDYFGVPYPLPKLDNIAAPGESQFFGAMENWGAILTFEKNLLLDPAITSPTQQNYNYVAEAHEVAHQWFGDLVTMSWWDDLWLNEGFASWMETKATARFNPGWFPLLSRVEGREKAMTLDGFATTHPVVQRIPTASVANQAFDAISYSKGEAVIAMLEAYAGEDTWRDGIRQYIRQHRYGNTTSDDLWQAAEQAGAAGITQIAHDFTLQPGVPLVRAEAACRGGETALTLSQGEFSRDRKEQVAASPQHWRVPLLIEAGAAPPMRQVLNGTASFTVPGCGAVIVNGGQLGYFRTLYQPAMVGQLAAALPGFAPIDQMGLVRDGYALAEAGYQPAGLALDLLSAVPGDANPVVAGVAVERWNAAYGLVAAADRPRIAALTATRWLPRLRELGFDTTANESLVDTDLRGTLLTVLGDMDEPTVVAEARRRFVRMQSEPKALDGPLKTIWLTIAARNATPAEWETLKTLATTAPSQVERQAFYRLLGAAKDPELAQKAFDFALTGQAGTSSAAIMSAVAGENPDFAFDYALAHRTTVDPVIDSGGQAEFFAGLARQSRDPAIVGKLESYAATLSALDRRPVDVRLSSLRQRLVSEPRMASEIATWLAAH